MAGFFGRPRDRLAGGGASSMSGFPSSNPESLSGGLSVVSISFVVGTFTAAPLRVLMRTLVSGSGVDSVVEGAVTVDSVVNAGTGVTLLKLLLLLLLEVPFFSAKVKGSSMIMQSELDPPSFSNRRTLVMLLDTGGTTSGGGCITGAVTGGVGVVGCLFRSTEAGIA